MVLSTLGHEAVHGNNYKWPAIYKRFIDDGFFTWERDIASLQHFLHMLNTHLPNIKITWKISQTNVDYMDLTVTKVIGADGRGRFALSTSQNSHNRYLYYYISKMP